MQDFNKEIEQTILAMKQNFGFKERAFESFSFGSVPECKVLLEQAMLAGDNTMSKFTYLPEFDEVADWLSDTKGKGLFLTGNVGRGKTNIIHYVLPVLFMAKFTKVVNCYNAEDVNAKFAEIRRKKFISIDEMGVEPIVNDYGAKHEAMNNVFNIAETESKVLFVSSNLTGSEILGRYGVRTMDRIKRLCRVIKFSGESLRR
ncbi:hypothetical protein SLH46_15230 [Draconibacterium sp. IB214405]|uniref:hypothetical protein n=1 Tax=Draconibacterium sp. IB214405 TaxID=3097352 RepID=UPI002A0E4450|nr:hypothetical protein [Draconibacterium sp. IB214405]MDX8340551.1 hypothetical protein [Draconibacterium sp. IB214405]